MSDSELDKYPYNSSLSIDDWRDLGHDPQRFNLHSLMHYEVNCQVQGNYLPQGEVILHDKEDVVDAASLCNTLNWVERVFPWLCLCIGVPSNLVALVTILHMKMSTGTLYVALLAGADLANIAIPSSFSLAGASGTRAVCKADNFLGNFANLLANWMLVLICLERWLTVQFPLKKNIFFTKRRATLLAIVNLVLSLALSSVFLHTAFVSDQGICNSGRRDSWEAVYSKAVTFICIIVPACLMLAFMILITVELRRNQRKRFRTFVSAGSDGGSCPRQGTDVMRVRLDAQAQAENALTLMLLLAALIFLVLSFPLFLLIVEEVPGISGYYSTLTERTRFWLFTRVAKHLEIFSHSLNFFVYFLSARKFRAALVELCKCRKWRRMRKARDCSSHTCMEATEHTNFSVSAM